MSDVNDRLNCPICGRPLNPNDAKESLDYNGEMIHIACVEAAERRQQSRRNPNNSYT